MKDYILIQNSDEGLGQIAVSKNVINDIVLNAIENDKNISLDEIRGIKTAPVVVFNEDDIVIDLKVRVQYGQDVEKSCLALQNELRKQLALMVEYHNPVINFNVVGFKFN